MTIVCPFPRVPRTTGGGAISANHSILRAEPLGVSVRLAAPTIIRAAETTYWYRILHFTRDRAIGGGATNVRVFILRAVRHKAFAKLVARTITPEAVTIHFRIRRPSLLV